MTTKAERVCNYTDEHLIQQWITAHNTLGTHRKGTEQEDMLIEHISLMRTEALRRGLVLPKMRDKE